jgi:hypothetical protein
MKIDYTYIYYLPRDINDSIKTINPHGIPINSEK